jgi:hypothetical protein
VIIDSFPVRSLITGACEKGYALVNGCDKFESSIGQYNNYVLDLLDASISKIQANGMKALVSVHDRNQLAGERIDVNGTT